MPKSVKVPANAVLIVWQKKTSSASSKGLWATYNGMISIKFFIKVYYLKLILNLFFMRK